MSYARPQWTGRPLVYSDGQVDEELAECPSCLAFHHRKSRACNGKREFTDSRCLATLAEIRCDRPTNHLGPHETRSESLRVEWERL